MKALGVMTACLLTGGAMPPSAAHAQNYPVRPVRIIVPLAVGGGTDIVARSLAQVFGDAFRQSVVVDNRPGAGSQSGYQALAAAEADGHTMMLLGATGQVFELLYKPRFTVADVLPISRISSQGYTVVVHPAVPAKTVKELVQHLRANPEKLNFASAGIGSTQHMAGELFKLATGTRAVHIPFKGMGAAYTELVAGRVQLAFPTILSAQPHITAGRVRLLAVTTEKRVEALPETPTLAESGWPGLVVTNSYGLVAKRGTPAAVINRISSEAVKAVRSPDFVARLRAEGSEPVGSSAQEFAAHLREQRDLSAKVIQQANIRPE